MTFVIGFKDPQTKIFKLAGDRMWSNEMFRVTHRDAKVFHKPEVNALMGFSGSYLQGELLRYTWKPPVRNDESLSEYIHGPMRRSILECFQENHYGYLRDHEDSDNDSDTYGGFIFVLENRLFEFTADSSILEHPEVCCIGSGAETGLGAYHVLDFLSTISLSTISFDERVNAIFHAVSQVTPFVSVEHDVVALYGQFPQEEESQELDPYQLTPSRIPLSNGGQKR